MKILKLNDNWYLKSLNGVNATPAVINDFDRRGKIKCRVPSFAHMYIKNFTGTSLWQTVFALSEPLRDEEAALLDFGSADFYAEVYLNGVLLGTHAGREDSFYFDVTNLLKKENRLAVKVSKPYEEGVPLDGFTFAEIPHRNELKTGLTPGSNYNESGLSGEVTLKILQNVFIDDLHIVPNVNEKSATVNLTVKNLSGSAATASVRLSLITPNGATADEKRLDMSVCGGKNTAVIKLYADFIELWDILNPSLYEVRAAVTVNGETEETIERIGFRTFNVGNDGLFYLNGKKLFLKCTHTGNFIPRSCHNLLDDCGYLKKDLIKAKAAGFNAVRFISGAATKQQLCLADEIGLMVYEEPVCSWLQRNGNKTAELYLQDLISLIKRDRNRPSVVMWGLLNETFLREPYDVACKTAKNALAEVRRADETRLIIYSSGRYDAELSVGSFSNPYTTTMQTLWNGEGSNGFAEKAETRFTLNPDMGDLHFYPSPVPITSGEKEATLNFGKKHKRPVFISETGIGSLLDTAALVKKYSENAARLDFYPDEILIKQINDSFLRDLKTFGFLKFYPAVGEIFDAAYLNHYKHRKLMFDLYRANKYVNGLSITGMLDHSVCGEGLWTLTREYKPKIADALENGFAPLRWSAVLSKPRLYNNESLNVLGVLANENVLKNQKYSATLLIRGENGVVYKKTKTFTPAKEDLRYFAIEVFNETVPLGKFKKGKYEVYISLDGGADDKAGKAEFYVDKFAATQRTVKTAEISDELSNRLKRLGYAVERASEPTNGKIIVENLTNGDEVLIKKCLGLGATVVLISADKHPSALNLIDETRRPEPISNYDWLYHKELLIKPNTYPFKGLKSGVADIDYYDGIFSETVFTMPENTKPDKTHAIAFSTGYPVKTGYIGGFQLAEFKVLNGTVIVNSLDLTNDGSPRPAADAVLNNLLK